MMGIMDRLTDKNDWHKKVYDGVIVQKWREEAMAIPDEEFMKVAAAPESEWARATEYPKDYVSTTVEGIMSGDAFDYVCSRAQHLSSLEA